MRMGTIIRPLIGENGTCAVPVCEEIATKVRVTRTGVAVKYCEGDAHAARVHFDPDKGRAK